jgi:hypothetical protein
VNEENEKKFITAIIKEITGSYEVQINQAPSLERWMATPAAISGEGRTILIGASHICRVVEFLPP